MWTLNDADIIRTDELDGLREAVADVGGTVVGDGDVDVTQAFPLHTGCSVCDVTVRRVGHV